jgi:hypothetical protein
MQGKTAYRGFVANISTKNYSFGWFHGQSVWTYLTPLGRTIR